MKRIITLMLAAGMMLGAYTCAQAATVKASGYWDFYTGWGNDSKFTKEGDKEKDGYFDAIQRLRLQLDIIASESLSGVVYFEMGDTSWGNSNSGGALGADSKVVELKRSYIDWIVPQTEVKVRMGIQGIALPSFVGSSSVLDDDVAGIAISSKLNDNVAATLIWARPYDTDDTINMVGDKTRMDEMDVFALAVPFTYDGVKVTPWGMYAQIGNGLYSTLSKSSVPGANGWSLANVQSGLLPASLGVNGTAWDDYATAWWGGVSGELTLLDPFVFSIDGSYGKVNAPNEALNRSGWLVKGLFEYKTGTMWGNPGLLGWYGSGDDGDTKNGSERMPFISASGNMTTMGWDGAYGVGPNTASLTNSGTGTWGAGIQIADISFVQDLSHLLRVTYIRGTNDSEMAKVTSFKQPVGVYMTSDDSAVELDFDSTYQIYENLTMVTEMGYIWMMQDDDVWTASDDKGKNMARVGVNLRYSF